MRELPADQLLVSYEYAVKPNKHASANFRWAILRDGRYLSSQNPEGAVRPLEVVDPFWYVGEWEPRAQLGDGDLARVRQRVESARLKTMRVAPERATTDGDLARLVLQTSHGLVRYEVEDQETDEHEKWIATIAEVFKPNPTARR
jgi:hypothetical protein